MGNSWPGARGEPGRQAAHWAGSPSDAFALLKDRRGAQWTTDMEAFVEYHIRTTWAEPHHKETQQQWATRLCAAYDNQEQAMREWLDRPMGATSGHGREQGGQAPDNSEGPPQGAGREEPRVDPEQPQGANWGQWSQVRRTSRRLF